MRRFLFGLAGFAGCLSLIHIYDFVQDQNTYVTFYGTIDFQGHVITKGENQSLIHIYR